MTGIHVVTDSSAQFPPPGLPDHYQVKVLPTALESPRQERAAPVLRGPSVQQFVEVYRRLRQETDEILSIHPSPGISDALSNAFTASQMFLGRSNIQVIDSKMVSMGLGLLVKNTAEAAMKGADYEQLVRVIHGLIPRLYAVFYLKDLMYLERNGLTSQSQAILGKMLALIPFLTI